jgi:hypothetical protein
VVVQIEGNPVNYALPIVLYMGPPRLTSSLTMRTCTVGGFRQVRSDAATDVFSRARVSRMRARFVAPTPAHDSQSNPGG